MCIGVSKTELLNGATNQTRAVILIQDHNDNSPKYPLDALEITVSENLSLDEPFYVVHTNDEGKKVGSYLRALLFELFLNIGNAHKNHAILYLLISSHPSFPVMVQPLTGQLRLTEPLDFEKIKMYHIRVKMPGYLVPMATVMQLRAHDEVEWQDALRSN
ncbi:unnamed protein product [Angiostrongylus costaricensis]|uniref:Cadherin domain-containing protein n=1 Tax=Angiostrongylus costaricensis TaxID=334426 RepID=A0A0R3PQV3_ANGCS|nr:unnamed protein product [Angiostrongylus costaricensis]